MLKNDREPYNRYVRLDPPLPSIEERLEESYIRKFENHIFELDCKLKLYYEFESRKFEYGFNSIQTTYESIVAEIEKIELAANHDLEIAYYSLLRVKINDGKLYFYEYCGEDENLIFEVGIDQFYEELVAARNSIEAWGVALISGQLNSE